MFRRLWLSPCAKEGAAPSEPPAGPPVPPLPRTGTAAITPQSVARIVQARGVHPAKLKRLGRHKSFDVLGEYLEFGDLFDGHPLSGVL
ncbi:MAG: hypothetical protein ABI224_00165 [Acetobacteraceae bacterium]